MSQVDHSKMLRNVSIASVVGATIEWYDFFLYGVVAGIVFNLRIGMYPGKMIA